MKITKNAIVLSNRESKAAGHHDNAECDDRAAEVFCHEIHKVAHDLANRTGRGVEVFATHRNCQPWVVYVCEPTARDVSPSVMQSPPPNSPSAWGAE